MIPTDRINPLLESFLMRYLPTPNMTMGAGPDSNNYLDVRNETHFQNQGTVRIDHNFFQRRLFVRPLFDRVGIWLLAEQWFYGDHGELAGLWR